MEEETCWRDYRQYYQDVSTDGCGRLGVKFTPSKPSPEVLLEMLL
jgi:hypothetical protein